MTRRALPKPVEAWGYWSEAEGTMQWASHMKPVGALVPGFPIRVRIVPITPKKRTHTKRKPKNPSKWTIGMTKNGIHAPHPSTRTKRKEEKK